jgi:EmrB/QacA subfamily drug resistance transporter
MSTVLHAYCDTARARLTQPAAPVTRPNGVLMTTILASSLAFIDGSVVNVGLPAIAHSLSADSAALQWVINAYLLPLSALLLLGGAAGDRFGHRRLLILGIVLFAAASLVCAIAPSLGAMLAGRLQQGVGAAMLMPNSLAILGRSFTGEEKGRAIGIWAASGAVMGAIGPVLGGWLIDLGSWRAIFLINLPLAVAAILLAVRFVPGDRDNGDAPLDFIGGALATLALGGLTWALTIWSGGKGWTSPAIFVATLTLVMLALFLIIEGQRGDRAMMPLALFTSRTFIGLTLLTFFLYGALGALLVLLPYVLIEAVGYSGTAAGAALLPLPLVLSLTSPIFGRLAGRIGPRLPLALGSLVVGFGFLLTLEFDDSSSFWTGLLPAILIIAVGLANVVAPLTTAVLSAVDARHTGSASGFNSTVARTGGLVATALLGTVFASHGPALLAAFHGAMTTCAAACAGAALSAFALVPTKEQTDPPEETSVSPISHES